MDEAVFIDRGSGRFVASELARGPWDPGAQHGGASAALLMREFERLPGEPGLEIARVTYELLRPVPLGELAVRAQIVRPGRRVQLLEATVETPDGVDLVRARALRVRALDASIPGTDSEPRPPGPEETGDQPPPFVPPHRPIFAPDAIELRAITGGSGTGAATVWFRLQVPLVAGEDSTPLQRLAAAADFGNGISSILPWDRYLFINPDLTVYVDRPPAGEWICLDARTRLAAGGVGISESVLYDVRGRVGTAIQALLVARR